MPATTSPPSRRKPEGHANGHLRVSSFAHIERVDVHLGDLTVLVGPQASGKSLILQLLKLAMDGPAIVHTMRKFGLVVEDENQLLARYLGQGMETGWSGSTRVEFGKKEVELASVLGARPRASHSVYFVPAHRTLTLSDGYPPAFQQLAPETPFVARQFSEDLRSLLHGGLGNEKLFPQPKRLKGMVRSKINDAIFHGADLVEKTGGVRRELQLNYGKRTQLSFMTWTAGQREFIPLLLGLYYLLPAGGTTKRVKTRYVVIEEPEMGLHPDGIMAFMLLALDLLERGYKVLLSTHSPLVLDVIWALRVIQENTTRYAPVLKLFGIDGASKATARGETKMAESALKSAYRVFLLNFNQKGRVVSKDISSLDPASNEPEVAGWGGLTGKSGHIGSVVSEVVRTAARVSGKARSRG